MYKKPEITDAECAAFSKKTGLQVSNRNWKGKRWPIVKSSQGRLMDTSYTGAEYTEIANKFSGDVLIMGLGFGKSVLDACDNPKVKSVTVVEINMDVAELFWLLHGKAFKGVKKLRIKECDAMEYTEANYDHVFIDCFHLPISKQDWNSKSSELRERFKESEIHQIRL